MKMKDVLAGVGKVLENLRDRNHALMEKLGIEPDDPVLQPEGEEGEDNEEGDAGESGDGEAEPAAAPEGGGTGGAEQNADGGAEPMPPADQFPADGAEQPQEGKQPEDDDDENMGESTVDEGIVGTLTSLAGSVGGMIAGNAVAPGIGTSVGGTIGGTLGGIAGQAIDSNESEEVDEDGEGVAVPDADPTVAPADTTAPEPEVVQMTSTPPEGAKSCTAGTDPNLPEQKDAPVDGGQPQDGMADGDEALAGDNDYVHISDEELAASEPPKQDGMGGQIGQAVASVAKEPIEQTAAHARQTMTDVGNNVTTAVQGGVDQVAQAAAGEIHQTGQHVRNGVDNLVQNGNAAINQASGRVNQFFDDAATTVRNGVNQMTARGTQSLDNFDQTVNGVRGRIDQVATDASAALRRANSTMDNVDQFTKDGRKFMKGAGLALGVGGGLLLGSMVGNGGGGGGGGRRRRRRDDYDESVDHGYDAESVFRSMDEAFVNEEGEDSVNFEKLAGADLYKPSTEKPATPAGNGQTKPMPQTGNGSAGGTGGDTVGDAMADLEGANGNAAPKKPTQVQGVTNAPGETVRPEAPNAQAEAPNAPEAPAAAEAPKDGGNFIDGLASDNTLSNSLMGAGVGALAGAAAGAIKHLFSSDKDKRKGSFIGSTLGGAVGGAAIGGIGAGLGTKFAPETTNSLIGKAREFAPGVANMADKGQALAVGKFGSAAQAAPATPAAPAPATPAPANTPPAQTADAKQAPAVATQKAPETPKTNQGQTAATPTGPQHASGGGTPDAGKQGQTSTTSVENDKTVINAPAPADSTTNATSAQDGQSQSGSGTGTGSTRTDSGKTELIKKNTRTSAKGINNGKSPNSKQDVNASVEHPENESVRANEDTIASGAGGVVGHMVGSIGGAMLGNYFGTPAAAVAAEKIGSAAGAAAGAALGAREGKKKKAALGAAAGSVLGGGVGAGLGGAIGHSLEESRGCRKSGGKSNKGRSWKAGRR